MPYGYVKYRIGKGDNPITVKSHAVVINQFFSFLTAKYGEAPDILNIRGHHVLEFLEQQYKEKKLSKSTVIKKQSHLKVFFDYLWDRKMIPIDYVCKIDYFGDNKTLESSTSKPIKYTYEELLQYEKKVLTSDISFKSKLLMIAYMKGIALHDIFTLKDHHFSQSGENLFLRYTSRMGETAELLITDQLEISVIKEAIEKAHSVGVSYILYGRTRDTGEYGPSSAANRTYLASNINNVLGITLKADDMRVAYVNYLYYKLGKSEQEISKMLGRSVSNIIKLRKQGVARIEGVSYNKVQMELELA